VNFGDLSMREKEWGKRERVVMLTSQKRVQMFISFPFPVLPVFPVLQLQLCFDHINAAIVCIRDFLLSRKPYYFKENHIILNCANVANEPAIRANESGHQCSDPQQADSICSKCFYCLSETIF